MPSIRTARSVAEVSANISYRVRMDADSSNIHRPINIGKGKFAKVFKAVQLSAGREVRDVAIKVLHDNATLADERLFAEEVRLLHELMTEPGVNVVNTLDILEMGPLIACGCGRVYWPACPNGCDMLLERAVRELEQYPCLYCPACKKELSARVIAEQEKILFRFPAKKCCREGATANVGTIINLVDRQAIVMELLDKKLSDYLPDRRDERRHFFDERGISYPSRGSRGQRGDALALRAWTWLRDMWSGDEASILAERSVLLEKTRLMVQLAESVAWLHTEKKIVHKDLTPDNIMVTSVNVPTAATGNSSESLVVDMTSAERARLRVIDFGLSDKGDLTRRWYEDTVTISTEKDPFLSPEARTTQEGISRRIKFVDTNRAIVPSELDILAGDIIADLRFPGHQHDLEVKKVEKDPSSDKKSIEYEGTPFPDAHNQQYAVVRRLGEPHDLYALGALFYFVLSEKITAVRKLSTFADRIRDEHQLELRSVALAAQDQYRGLREEIPEKFWQDELLLLTLRAMVRGRPESLMSDRVTRDSRQSLVLLAEIRRIHHHVHRELLGARDIVRFRRYAVFLAALAVSSALSLALLLLRYRNGAPSGMP